MKGKIKKVVDRTLIYYLIIGVLNFIVCTALMFLLFNVCGFSDHVAPLFNYGLGSVIWYLACRYILFPNQRSTTQQILRFVLEVIACYFICYYVIAPIVSGAALKSETIRNLFSFGGDEPDMIAGNCEMTIGTVFYAIVNYFGQRYYVFNNRFDRK